MPHIEHRDGWPSVTEVLRDYAMSWYKFFVRKYGTVELAEAYAKGRAEIGTKFHLLLELHLKKLDYTEQLQQLDAQEIKAWAALTRELERLDLTLVASEREVESKQHLYHGSLDGLVKIGNPSMLPNEDFLGTPVTVEAGVLTIADLKTKENDKPLTVNELKKHSMQLSAYAQAIYEEDNTQTELGLIIQLDIPTATVRLHCVYPLQRFLRPFLLQREQFDYINGRGEWVSKKKRRGK